MRKRMTGDVSGQMEQQLLPEVMLIGDHEQVVLPEDYNPQPTAEFRKEHEELVAEGLIPGTGTEAIDAVSYTNHCNEEKGKTMATIVKKSDLKFVDGFLSLDGTIVSPSVADALNELEGFLQRAKFENENRIEARPNFVRESNFETEDGLIKVPAPKTPVLDADAEHAEKVSEELHLIESHDQVHMVLDQYNSVVEFVTGSTVVLYDGDYKATLIDTPTLGNPLTLKKDKLLKLICEAVEYPLG